MKIWAKRNEMKGSFDVAADDDDDCGCNGSNNVGPLFSVFEKSKTLSSEFQLRVVDKFPQKGS